MKKIWLIDSGHGGMINGEYQTAPDKMYTHHDGSVFYEGVFNRTIKMMLLDRLKDAGVKYIDLCPSEIDMLLKVRTDVANTYHIAYDEKCFLLSLHSNAGGGTGFEVFCDTRSTKSRLYGNMLGMTLNNAFPDIQFREADDGQFCKKANFWILRYSFCPALLVECLFFDNWYDYQLLIDIDFQIKYVESLVQFILNAELTHF